MGLLEDLVAEMGSETPTDPLAQMASELVLGRGEQRPPPKNMLEALSNIAGVIPGGQIGSGLGMITPTGWRNIAPEAKAMVNLFADQFPGWFQAVLKHPRELAIHGVADLPEGTAGTFQNVNPLLDRIKLAIGRGFRDPGTVPHEFTHYLTADKLKEWLPQHAEQLGTELNKILPKGGKGSLTNALDDLQGFSDLFSANKGFTTKSDTEFLNTIRRAIGSEGLAHLAERTIYPETSTKLMDLARKLGVGAPAYESSTGSTLVDDVLKSLSQLGGQ